MEEEHRICPDSEHLGYCESGKLRIGYISEVNGPDAVETREFAPTRHELIQLVKYWLEVALRSRLRRTTVRIGGRRCKP